jgi:hypothetical protein
MARYQARMALDVGRYDNAAEYYAIAFNRRSRGDALRPIDGAVLQCARAAKRVAYQERQRLKKRAARIADDEPPPEICHNYLDYLNEGEKLLLAIHSQFDHEAVSTLGVRRFLSLTDGINEAGIRGLFYIHHLGSLAEKGDGDAAMQLSYRALRYDAQSHTARRLLTRLKDADLAAVDGALTYIREVEHGRFLAVQREAKRRLEARIDVLRIF